MLVLRHWDREDSDGVANCKSPRRDCLRRSVNVSSIGHSEVEGEPRGWAMKFTQ